MDSIEIMKWVASAASVIGMVLIARKNVAGWFFYLFASLWFVLIYAAYDDLPLIILWSLFLIGNIYGLMNWAKHDRV